MCLDHIIPKISIKLKDVNHEIQKTRWKQKYCKWTFKEVNKCKPEELHSLLHKIEKEIEKSKGKDENLLSAKRIITSRIASMRSKNL